MCRLIFLSQIWAKHNNFFPPEKHPFLTHKPLWLLHHFSPSFIAQYWGRARTPSSVCFQPFFPEPASGFFPMKITISKVPSDRHGATSDTQFQSCLHLSVALGTVDHFLSITQLFPFPSRTPHSLIFLLSLVASVESPVLFLLIPNFCPWECSGLVIGPPHF